MREGLSRLAESSILERYAQVAQRPLRCLRRRSLSRAGRRPLSGARPRAGDLRTVHERVLRWYADAARPLPWRAPGTTPWGVLVSEVMAQQTPVARVEPVWRTWLSDGRRRRPWPPSRPGRRSARGAGWGTPSGASAARGRRCHPRPTRRHGPSDVEALLALPGVGEYTAAAVACFAFGHPTTVVDTNIRRVLARLSPARAPAAAPDRGRAGLAEQARPTLTADAVVECRGDGARRAGLRRRAPRCEQCPVAELAPGAGQAIRHDDGRRDEASPGRGPTGSAAACSSRPCVTPRPGRQRDPGRGVARRAAADALPRRSGG